MHVLGHASNASNVDSWDCGWSVEGRLPHPSKGPVSYARIVNGYVMIGSGDKSFLVEGFVIIKNNMLYSYMSFIIPVPVLEQVPSDSRHR